MLFYDFEYRVKWPGKKNNRTREHSFYVDRTVTEVNCKAITNGDEFELRKADLLHNVSRNILLPEDYIKMTQNCPQFVLERGYITDHLTDLEIDFPIAFSLLMFKDVEQAERLLRAIYRPQNFYCIHVDAKSDASIYSAMQGVASCFKNMHVLDMRVDVQWGYFSVLEPELICMEHLWNRSVVWRYFINLTGQEFPLRTNYELVRILQAYKGANDVDATVKRYSPCVYVNKAEGYTCITKYYAVRAPLHDLNIKHSPLSRRFIVFLFPNISNYLHVFPITLIYKAIQ